MVSPKKIFLLFFTFFLPSAGAFLFADDAQVLDEVIVSATRVESTTMDAPSYATVITKDEIEKTTAVNLAQLLSEETGLQLRDYGIQGGVKTIGIRGSLPSQVLILKDGIRLNSARDGGADLNDISLENVERIEIIRTGGSSLYGSDAVAGIINIITRKPDKDSLNVSVTNGSYIPHHAEAVSEGPSETASPADWLDLLDTQQIKTYFTLTPGKIGIQGSGSFTRAANGFTWYDTTYIGDWRRRIHAASIGGEGETTVTVPAGKGSMKINGSFGLYSKEVPGSLDPSYITTDAMQTDTSAGGSFSYKNDRLLSDRGSLDLKAFYKYHNLHYTDPDEYFPTDATHISHTAGTDVTQEIILSPVFSTVFGGSVYFDAVNSTSLGDNLWRINPGVFFSLPIHIGDSLSITPTGRYDAYYDYNSDFTGHFTFALSTVWKANDWLAVKATGGSAYRAPTFNDMYWPADAWSAGNPNLKPETSYSGEAGVSMSKGIFGLDLYGYARYVDNGILWLYDSTSGKYMPQNIEKGFYPGVDAEGRIQLWKRFFIKANYSFLYSFVLQDASTVYGLSGNKRMPYTPMNSFTGKIGYDYGNHAVWIDATYEGSRFTDSANTDKLDPYFLLSIEYRGKISDTISVNAAVRNLLNASFETQKGYPMPPISFWTGVTLSL